MILLAENGNAKAYIVVAPDATHKTLKPAADLARCLNAMTGAEFQIGTTRGPRGMMDIGLGIWPGETGPCQASYRIMADARSGIISLIGDDRGDNWGTDWAVHHFLHLLGCRWIDPGNFGPVGDSFRDRLEVPETFIFEWTRILMRRGEWQLPIHTTEENTT